MSEEVLGVQPLQRPALARTITETLLITPDRMVVARTSGGKGGAIGGLLGGAIGGAVGGVLQARDAKKKTEQYSQISLESILKADKNNYAIPNAEIQKIEIKSRNRFHITTTKEQHKWYLSPKEMGWTTSSIKEDIKNLENILRPIFGDRLSVEK